MIALQNSRTYHVSAPCALFHSLATSLSVSFITMASLVALRFCEDILKLVIEYGNSVSTEQPCKNAMIFKRIPYDVANWSREHVEKKCMWKKFYEHMYFNSDIRKKC